MCADWSIHDKGDGNPHVHLLVTMRPFNPDHSWGSKEVKDWDFVRDTDGNIVVDESHPDWYEQPVTWFSPLDGDNTLSAALLDFFNETLLLPEGLKSRRNACQISAKPWSKSI